MGENTRKLVIKKGPSSNKQRIVVASHIKKDIFMKIDVIATAGEVTTERVKGKVACIIDVFRATSVISSAMANGAKQIIPMTEIQDCFSLKEKMLSENPDQKIILAGERKMVLIEGFELDNSPRSFTHEKIAGATIIMSTTNGTRALNCANQAQAVFVASMLDAKEVCHQIEQLKLDVVLICAGRNNRFTLEDGLCAGKMANILSSPKNQLTDMAWVLKDLYIRHKDDIQGALENCFHYHRMMGNGLQEDIEYCLQEDIFNCAVRLK